MLAPEMDMPYFQLKTILCLIFSGMLEIPHICRGVLCSLTCPDPNRIDRAFI